jgi:hypothetical protein
MEKGFSYKKISDMFSKLKFSFLFFVKLSFLSIWADGLKPFSCQKSIKLNTYIDEVIQHL